MPKQHPNIGDIVKIPQNALLTKNCHESFRRINKPTYAFVTGVNPHRWPTTYSILIENESWEAYEDDLYVME